MTEFTKNWTKEKQRESYLKWYAKNKEKRKKYLKKWRAENRGHLRRYNKARYDQEIKKAWNLARKIKIPQNKMCQNCGKNKATCRHHPDYKKPMQVIFVCQSCNQRLPHKNK